MFRTPYERLKLRFRVIRETLGLLKRLENSLGHDGLEISLTALKKDRVMAFTYNTIRLD